MDDYFEPRFPCDGTQNGRSQTAIGEAGTEEIRQAMMDSTVSIEVIKSAEFENVIVNTTVQDQTVAFYTDSRWLKIAHYQVLKVVKAAGISLR